MDLLLDLLEIRLGGNLLRFHCLVNIFDNLWDYMTINPIFIYIFVGCYKLFEMTDCIVVCGGSAFVSILTNQLLQCLISSFMASAFSNWQMNDNTVC
jgi:hypothetical protein